MAPDKLFVNITDKEWALSFDDPSTAKFPVMFYKDNRHFSLTVLYKTDQRTVAVYPSVSAVKVALFNGSTVLTSATYDSIDGNEFIIVLPLTGSAMDSFMSTKTTDQLVDFHLLITTDKGQNRYKLKAYISPEGISATNPDPTIDEPAITMSQAQGVLLSKEWPQGGFMIVTDEVDGARFRVRVVNKEFKFEPLSA